MKIVRINKGKVVNLPIRLVSAVIMVVITISLMDALPEPWSIFIAIAIASILPGIWFASYVIIITQVKKTLFDGIWTMGHKFGKPIKYDSIEKIFINQVKTKNDETVSIPSVTLQRVYTDRNGNRAYTHSLRRDDILPAAYALCEAYGFISRGGVEEAEDEA